MAINQDLKAFINQKIVDNDFFIWNYEVSHMKVCQRCNGQKDKLELLKAIELTFPLSKPKNA